jgi:predicted dehydrogenase
MALDMTPQQKEIGKENFRRATTELSRRGFLKGLVAAGATVPVAAAAFYGYQFEKLRNRPVRTALIGAGDEGGVLVGEHNPAYLEFVAYADIRPYNQKRIFEGEKPPSPRRGFNHHYGNDADKKIKAFKDYRELLKDTSLGIEAVVIALPLHLHAPVAIDAMNAGKHVLCEKLMGWNIQQCKQMIETADHTGKILTIGHQRHYSLLYAQAEEALRAGVLGDVKHIRALWHRNNSWPKVDKEGKVIPGSLRDGWKPDIRDEDRQALEGEIRKWGYKNMEELVRWRLFNRTGGGLMAELGSHQLDACSIFLGKVHPLAVSGVGGKFFYTDDREADDHVFVTFEFPGPNYYNRDKDGKSTKEVKNKNDIVVVTYSSVNTNSFEKYGECVMGSRGTMVVEQEQSVMLYAEPDPNSRDSGPPRSTAVTVTSAPGGQPALESTASYGGAAAPAGARATTGPADTAESVSRGYREEMEHFAYCIRMQGEAKSDEEKRRWQLEPRCHGRVAMADAIIALTSNQAMRKHQRIAFKEEWFDAASKDVPDADMIVEEIKA